MSDQPLERRQKRWAPKVRTGCLTCKKRKKRCDEAKPICQTCAKGGYICDGYQPAHTNAKPSTQKPDVDAGGIVSKPPRSPRVGARLSVLASKPRTGTASLSVVQKRSSTILSNAQLNATLSTSDDKFIQFFIINVAPVLATTERWRSFWETTIPCASTHNIPIHHAVIALSASYESKAVGVDRQITVLQQVNNAMRASLSRDASTSDVLILCRLLASVCQSKGDWMTARIHLQHGWKVLLEAIRAQQVDNDLVQLLAPTFMCAAIEPMSHLITDIREDLVEQQVMVDLERIRSRFMVLFSPMNVHTGGRPRTGVLLAWSIMTQAMCSLICSEAFAVPVEQRTVSAQDLKVKLKSDGTLLSMPELQKWSSSVFQEVETFMRSTVNDESVWPSTEERLQIVVENFLVQAAQIQPNINITTFWYDERFGTGCAIVEFAQHEGKFGKLLCSGTSQHDAQAVTHHGYQQERAYYLEFICPYRSGLMPAFLDQS